MAEHDPGPQSEYPKLLFRGGEEITVSCPSEEADKALEGWRPAGAPAAPQAMPQADYEAIAGPDDPVYQLPTFGPPDDGTGDEPTEGPADDQTHAKRGSGRKKK